MRVRILEQILGRDAARTDSSNTRNECKTLTGEGTGRGRRHFERRHNMPVLSPHVETMKPREAGCKSLVMVTVRITREERAKLNERATKSGVSVNRYCVQKLLEP